MKLLLDQHLSWRLGTLLIPAFEAVAHVRALGLAESDDAEIFAWARTHDHAVVTKDADFSDLVVRHGPPPLVVWLRLGNAGTERLAAVLVAHRHRLELEARNSQTGLVILQG
jgi:predicted nuclease of predicted toxin-antitoxin system